MNKIIFGLENVHVAFRSTNGYDTPIHVPGAVNLGLGAEGEDTIFYADNIEYFTATSNNGYAGDLEMALVPDAVKAEMLGWEIDSNGMLVEVAEGKQKEFALLYEVKGNAKNKRYVYYSCKASRPNEDHATKAGNIEPQTQSLSLKISPAAVDGKLIVKGGLELSATNEAVYNSWYNGVIVPDALATEVGKTILIKKIAIAETLVEVSYEAAGWIIFSAALASAKAVNLDTGATQQEVDAAVRELNDAILQLVAA